jgi:hypothetical protein
MATVIVYRGDHSTASATEARSLQSGEPVFPKERMDKIARIPAGTAMKASSAAATTD